MALEKRGKKITTQSQSDAAWRMVADKWEKLADQRFDTFPGGPRAGEKTRGPGKKNTAKMDKLKKIAGVGRKKINSNPAKNASGSTGKQAIKAISKARGGKTKVSPMAKVRKPSNFRGRGGGRGGVIGGGFLDQLK